MINRIGGAILILGLLIAPAFAEERAGIGVDAHGGGVVDPTKNVLDLVLAAVTRLNDLMAAQTRRADDLRASDSRLQDSLRDAETRRVNELAAQKQVFDLELARGIRANVDASALLLATQVRELKTDTSDRIAKLEQFANEQRGRSSGQGDTISYLFLVLGAIVGIGGLIVAFIMRSHPRQTDPTMAAGLAELAAARQRANGT